jgi:uncharacterized protein
MPDESPDESTNESTPESPPKPFLNPYELRVLGVLIEKEITTPYYYPLTLNSVVAACNQKSNRDPLMTLTAEVVQGVLDGLRRRGLVVEVHSHEDRVPKFRQRWTAAEARLTPDEIAVMAELMLRGPQTVGELRGRAARMHAFADLGQVQLTLDGLMERSEGAMVALLPRQPGFKERRYAHRLGGPVSLEEQGAPPAAPPSAAAPDRTPPAVEALEQDIAQLRHDLDELRGQFMEFKKLLG